MAERNQKSILEIEHLPVFAWLSLGLGGLLTVIGVVMAIVTVVQINTPRPPGSG